MKNNKTVVIATTSIIIIGILYFAIKKSNVKDINTDAKLKADFDLVIKNIENAKK
jgi:hypothetical protein